MRKNIKAFLKRISQFNNSPFFVPLVILIIFIFIVLTQPINSPEPNQGTFDYEQF